MPCRVRVTLTAEGHAVPVCMVVDCCPTTDGHVLTSGENWRLVLANKNGKKTVLLPPAWLFQDLPHQCWPGRSFSGPCPQAGQNAADGLK